MPDFSQRDAGGQDAVSPRAKTRVSVSERLELFERRQRELWRLTFLLLFALAVAYVVVSWDSIRAIAQRYEALVPGLVVLIALFVAYAWTRNREISQLRGLIHGLEHRDAAPPTEKQFDQLFSVIARSQQGYRDLIDSFEDVLLSLSLQGEIRAVNRSFADLLGLSFQQIVGRHVSEFLDEASGDGPGFVQRTMPRFLERRQWSGVLHIRLKNGAVYFFDCVAHAMVRDGQAHGVTILARDITALRRSEARFTELFETLQEGIYIVTPDDRILDVNPSLVRMLGYDSKEELLSRKVSEIFPDNALREAMRGDVDRHAMLEGREIMLMRKNGQPIICLNTAAAVRDITGKVVRYQGALMDISARREIERRLYKQQEFARRLIDSFPDLILVLDTGGRYTFVSPRIREVLGYESTETIATRLGETTHPEDQPALRALYDDVIAGRQSFASVEIRARHKNGEWRRIRCNVSPLFTEEGKIEGVVISGRDVTELKRLEEQLIQAEKLAAMGQMLAGVAHELNNPLTAILGVSEIGKEREGLDEATKRQLELTHRQARRAARIVQNLLEFSRPASPQKRSIEISTVLERTLQLHENSLRRNNIEVDLRVPPGIPGIIGDTSQLIQVFLNLVLNAEQAIHEIRDSGRIQIRVAGVGRRVSVTVQDDGSGIKEEHLPRIFDPFYTTKRPGGGTGLGLSICMSILREHGGSIEAESLPAGGSAFTVFLPAVGPAGETTPATETPHGTARAMRESHGAESVPVAVASAIVVADAASEAPQVKRETVSAKSTLAGRSILILDDEESIRDLLSEGLSAHGLAVELAATEKAAAEAIAQRDFDAILCDLHLDRTEGGGHAAAQKLLAMTAKKPAVIFMTGDLVDETRRMEELGGAACLQKPFRISEVLAELRRAFGV